MTENTGKGTVSIDDVSEEFADIANVDDEKTQPDGVSFVPPKPPPELGVLPRIELVMPDSCILQQAWDAMPHADRPTTPIQPYDAMKLMAVGFWLGMQQSDQPASTPLSPYFRAIIRELEQQAERERIAKAALIIPPERQKEYDDAMARIREMG